jgi:hypothetical protein
MAGQETMHFPMNAAAEALAPLIGVWDSVGTHGLIPDTTLHGRTSFEWLEPGGLVRLRSSIQEDVGIPAGTAVIGSDDESGTYSMVYYDERGVSRIYAFAVRDDGFRWWRDSPTLAQRYTLTIADGGRTLIGKGELSQGGAAWHKDLDLTYTRVGP